VEGDDGPERDTRSACGALTAPARKIVYGFMKRATVMASDTRSAADGVCEVDCIDGRTVAAARAALPAAASIDGLAGALKVLANPARLRLVLALAQHELCVCDCARLLGQSLSAASQHLKELRRIGAVQFRQDGKLAYYRLVAGSWCRHLRPLLDEVVGSEETAA